MVGFSKIRSAASTRLDAGLLVDFAEEDGQMRWVGKAAAASGAPSRHTCHMVGTVRFAHPPGAIELLDFAEWECLDAPDSMSA
jgi:hypothetical protein